MGTKTYRSHNWTLISGILWLVLLVAAWTFGQDQPPQQNQPAPGSKFMGPAAGGPMPQGMPGPGMRRPEGPGMMPGGPDMGQGGSITDLLQPEVQKELAITAEQRQKLDDIRFNSEKESIQHRSALRILHLELSRLIDSENPDRAAIDKKIQEVAHEEASLMRSSINTRLNARALLTAEQRTKLAQLMQNRIKGERLPAEGGMPPRQAAPRAGQAKERVPLPVAPEKPQEQ